VPDHDPEHSDLLLYHVKILEEMGEVAEALTLLGSKEKSKTIVDQVAVMEIRGTVHPSICHVLIDTLGITARLLLKQGPGADAEQAWRALIQRNPDNISYYYGFFNSKNIELGSICPTFWHVPTINYRLINCRNCRRCRPS
jgi:N-alpha-acetyltransferase 15/16, NatA auxiliary subunit